jgi:hypothetical protein
MNPRLLIALVVVAVAVAAGAMFLYAFKREWVTETAPPSGEARYNRFFALQRILQDTGQPARSGAMLDRILPALQPGDTVVIGDDVGRIRPDQARTLIAWVRTGGHLVFMPAAYANRDVPLMDQLGWFDERENKPLCASLSADGSQDTLRLCGSGFHLRQHALAQADAVLGDNAKGLLFARGPEGRGTVSVLGSMSMLSGNNLKHAPQQQFARRLLAPNRGRGRCYLLYELIGASFWVSLFVRGWPALLASLVLVLGWMSARSERFGPLAPAPGAYRRAWLEHIHAAGEFLFRRDGGRSLHQLACEALLARLHRGDPASAMLQGDELFAWLAQRSRLEPAHIELAFRSPANATAFRGSIITLARLRSHL